MTLRGRRLKMNFCLFVLIIKSMIPLSFSRSLDSLNFPDTIFPQESIKLSPPEPCQSGINFCGEDETKYPPQDLIELVINSNSKVQQWIDETTFHQNEIEEETSETEDSSIIPACQSRREKLPNFLRFRNIKNKWKYIIKITHASNSSSNAEIMICEKPGKTCINDGDSPDGEGSTVCRQAYRHQRLLAMDENGEASVDSFALPSGCICHHLQNDPNLRQAYILRNTSKTSEGKEIPEHELPSVDLRIPSIENQLKKRRCELEEAAQISLSEGRIRRSNDRIIFPGDTESENVVPMKKIPDEDPNWGARSGEPSEDLVLEEKKEDPMFSEVDPCPNGEDFCELLASYPKNFIDAAVNRSNFMNNLHPVEFNKFHSVVCQDEIFDGVDQRIGTFENGEIPLCVSITEIIHPQKGRNIYGQWRHIVNTNIYKQGVSLEKCVKHFEGRSCLYDGAEGIFPEATVCKQQYSKHPFVVISPSGEKMVELFKIPTACVCHILDKTLF